MSSASSSHLCFPSLCMLESPSEAARSRSIPAAIRYVGYGAPRGPPMPPRRPFDGETAVPISTERRPGRNCAVDVNTGKAKACVQGSRSSCILFAKIQRRSKKGQRRVVLPRTRKHMASQRQHANPRVGTGCIDVDALELGFRRRELVVLTRRIRRTK